MRNTEFDNGYLAGIAYAMRKQKHGKWIEHTHTYWDEDIYVTEEHFITIECSNCLTEFNHEIKSNYCPECGAKMDLEVQSIGF